ncbi:MAG TPA: DsrE family protein [Gallionellaceae bacterium]|nr:DsrE family protein [Gallionellaceae bacterium]
MPTLNNLILFTITITALTPLHPSHAESNEANQTAQYSTVNINERQNINVVYDVKDDVWEAGVGKALFFLNGLMGSYSAMGVPQEQVHISVIMHGSTAYWLLKENAYQIHKNDPFDFNPNEHIVQELLAKGVSVEICNSTMKAKGWTEKDILPGVVIVHDAYSRLIDLQMRKYAYIRF